jgi:glyoxylase-like metal-dependent hydrolase (beta-lactamase superfamily II)
MVKPSRESKGNRSGSERIKELRPGIFQFYNDIYGSHVYLLRGSDKNILIDTGMTSNFQNISGYLQKLGLNVKDIHFVILTHEHTDHTGATAFFCNTAVISAHRLAANKIEMQDDFVTYEKYIDGQNKNFYAHLWLEDNMIIDLDNYKLQIIHTPGHTSGCICIYESGHQLLFSGDTVFANGTLSDIYVSGNISDYVTSLQRLNTMKITELYPGHGRISLNPEPDIKQAVVNAQNLMADSKVLFEAIVKKTGVPTVKEFLKGRDVKKR